MKRYSIFLSIFIASLIFGQNYTWPTRTGKQLTSNFGEFRSNHFHMGLDIRTYASTGHPLYAISDGYIHRIATNFSGYGKALYLKTFDGNIALYGHLNRFADNMENRLFDLQIANQSYFVNKYFTQDEYLVKRGETIGYSGNSGGSMGPHLHFELRNGIDQPLNPMNNGFPLNDNVAPIFMDLALIPLAGSAQIDNSSLPKNYPPRQLTANSFTLNDTIDVAGKFGITTRVIDKIQNASNSYQIERLELFVDSISVFSTTYKLLDFSEGKHIATIYGQPNDHPKSDKIQKLYRIESYPKISIHTNNNTGILDLSEGIRKIEIVADDAVGNSTTLGFYVRSASSNHEQRHNSYLKLNGYPEYVNNSTLFEPKLIQLEKGTIFQLQTILDDSVTVEAFIENTDALLTFSLLKIDNNFVSDLINSSLFTDTERCGFLFYSDSIKKYEFDFIPNLILPNSSQKIFAQDSLCMVKVDQTFYDTTFMWIDKYPELINAKSSKQISNIYEIQPYGIPYQNKIDVSFFMKDMSNLKHLGIYTLNRNKMKWNFVNSTIDNTTNTISAKLSNSAIVAVLKDTKTPWFISTFPKHQQSYLRDSFKKIQITVDDNLSGINADEKYLKVYLDGKRIWVAYQPVKKEISYRLREKLSIGEHNIQINISDRSGNSTTKSIKFFIE